MLQVMALYYRETQDMVEAGEERRQGFKYALLATGHIPVAELFPEVFTAEADEDDIDNDEDAVTLKFEDREMSPEAIERELAQLMAGGEVTVNGAEVFGG